MQGPSGSTTCIPVCSVGSAVPYLQPHLGMRAGAKLHVKPEFTKNKKSGHCISC